MSNQELNRSRKKPRRWIRVLLWLILTPVTLLALSATVLWASPSAREWTATKLLTGQIIRRDLDGVPPRSKSQPVIKTPVSMRDGVELATQVYLPEGEGPWPVILVRDPYSFAQYLSCKVFVQYEYACVYQEVRGRGESKGVWYPFVHDREDGLDTIAWILKQPWQNGRLAMHGGSYVGAVQWAVAGDAPAELKTIVPTVAHGDVYELAYRNGMFNQAVAGSWLFSQMRSLWGTVTAESTWKKEVAGRFPAAGIDPALYGKNWKPYEDYILHPEKADPYWQSPAYVALRESHKSTEIPVLMIGFANDFFLPRMLTTFEELPARDRSVFVIGPGNHGGQEDPEVEGHYADAYVDTLAWFDHHLRDAPLPDSLRPGLRVFTHGDGSWRHLQRWPESTAGVRLYLDRLDKSQACDGGVISDARPGTHEAVTYVYDPRNPVPTKGGPFLLLSPAVEEQGNELCERDDVLSFASAPLSDGSLIDGPIRVRLQVSSDAEDTAFTVKLSEHFADGRVYNIRDDITSLSLRNGAMSKVTYQPGEIVDVEFNLTPISWRLAPGSRLRLDISSSSAPAFFPHPNRGGLWSEVENPVSAKQTLRGGYIEMAMVPAIR